MGGAVSSELNQRVREPRAPADKQVDAGALQPMPHKDVHYERENAFID